MSAAVIDGKAIAAQLRAAVAGRVRSLPYRPGLAVVLVGDDPASAVYVRNKDRAARNAGIEATTHRLPATTSQDALLALVAQLNADPSVDGILVQLPLPAGLDRQRVIEAIDPAKDVDGLHPENVGRLASGLPALTPCTPLGVMKLLGAAGVALTGCRAAVIGRSPLVGRPLAGLLTSANATVTVLHSRSRDLAGECRRAEVLVAAVGVAGLVRGDWIGEGAVVIDVGINRTEAGALVGDVVYDECAARASAITPVPGGVGPMTIACLLENTVTASVQRRG